MLTHHLGYPRIGLHRELKWACEHYWAGKITADELMQTSHQVREANWSQQKVAGLDWITCGDFSLYDHVLDMCLMMDVIPERFRPLQDKGIPEIDLYFAMARGFQRNGWDIPAMEMTKWFDTNYHYIVPEFRRRQSFELHAEVLLEAYATARQTGLFVKPALIGPVSFLLSGKMFDSAGQSLDLLPELLPVYAQLLLQLQKAGATWVQIDEPFLVTDLTDRQRDAYREAYSYLHRACPDLKLLLTTYFGGLDDALPLTMELPVQGLHLDLVRAPEQLQAALKLCPADRWLSLGIVDGRNVWKNDLTHSLSLIEQAITARGEDRILLAPSCSLLYVPYDLKLEEKVLPAAIKPWLAFARQKLEELVLLKKLCQPATHQQALRALLENQLILEQKHNSTLIHRPAVAQRIATLQESDTCRAHPFPIRQARQKQVFQLPLLPTTTIGSFPQTPALRQLRAKWQRGEITNQDYEQAIQQAIREAIRFQEEIGLDVLVHGEFERSDMVEYFARQLEGFAFTEHGWVQSYGSRCVKPPILYGDVQRTHELSVRWIQFAQSLTRKPVKGMLTGPVTMLKWSFVRNDQTPEQTCYQLALAIRDEVQALEQAGIRIIQIDEPAFREGLPLRNREQQHYLQWAVKAFRIASSVVSDTTQIHTHMCYSEFNSIMPHIAALDADVITIEASRSNMDLLDAFARFSYPNEIGPGIYDIHSPRVPSVEEMVELLQKASRVIPIDRLWVNPDCGLKTRNWPEVKAALRNMVEAARRFRSAYASAPVSGPSH